LVDQLVQRTHTYRLQHLRGICRVWRDMPRLKFFLVIDVQLHEMVSLKFCCKATILAGD